jgi:hypothetical protein
MTAHEKRVILSEHLDRFRAWSYADLAEAIDRTRRQHNCLDHVAGTAVDGTQWQVEINVFWDGQRGGDVRVIGDLTAEPQRPIAGFIPIDTPDLVDSFIMRPDGTFVDE